MNIALTPVVSSNIQAIGHDGQSLAVQFKGGRTYHYADVPAEIHAAMTADGASVGAQFASLVRGKFEGVMVDDGKPKESDERV